MAAKFISQAEIDDILRQHRFYSAFQPICTLDTLEVVGYEALTRFEGGWTPDVVFGSARYGIDLQRLEVDSIHSALNTAPRKLNGGSFLALNLSPLTISQRPGELIETLSQADRPLVVEITEHLPVVDYEQMKNWRADVRAHAGIAIDDLGANDSGIRTLVELHPEYLKMDISLIRELEGDCYRQALVAALVKFADRVGCKLIAEGVETVAELRTLRELGVPLGQGFLLGRPERDPITRVDPALVRILV